MRFLFVWVWELSFFVSLAICCSIVPAQDSVPGQDAYLGPANQQTAQSGRGLDFNPEYREGKEVQQLRGTIRVVQERYVFFPQAGAYRFVLLENLNLERIARAMAESTGEIIWELDAEVTEFSGSNFLIVQRAQIVGT